MAQLELLLLQFTKQNMYAFFLCLLSSSRSLRVTWESPHTSKTVGGVPIHLWLLHIASCSFSRQSTQRTWTSWTDTPWIYQFCEETDWKIHWLACNKSQESVLEIRPKKGTLLEFFGQTRCLPRQPQTGWAVSWETPRSPARSTTHPQARPWSSQRAGNSLNRYIEQAFFNVTWEGGRGQVLRDVEFFPWVLWKILFHFPKILKILTI